PTGLPPSAIVYAQMRARGLQSTKDGNRNEITSWGAGELLPRSRSPASLPVGPYLVQGEAAIFVRVHCLEDPLVSRLKLLLPDVPVTITVHQSENHPRIRATQAHTSSDHTTTHLYSTHLPL